MSPEATRNAQKLGRDLAKSGFKPDQIIDFVHGRQHGYVLRAAYDKQRAKIIRKLRAENTYVWQQR